jgi:ABC-type branched-subunit amino acid transport system ATPase component
MTQTQQVILEARGVRVVFGGVVAVEDAALRVPAGVCHGLVGPNGAGKTTMLNALSGVVRTQAGEIRLQGRRVETMRARRRRYAGLARTFQNPALVPDLSALENVMVGLFPSQRWSSWRDLAGRGLTASRERATEAAAAASLEAVGFPTSRWKLAATQLSHGDQKIVDLARALAGRPEIVLLDEPTAGLTVEEMDLFAEVLRTQRDEHGATLVVVSHHMRFLASLAETVTVMESGRVLADGTFASVAAQPEVVAAFLGEYDATF